MPAGSSSDHERTRTQGTLARWLARPGWHVWAVILLSVLFAVLAVGSLASASTVWFDSDSNWYAQIAAQRIDQASFWTSSRPWVYPLVLKLHGIDYDRTVRFQIAVHILSHVLLAVCLFVALGKRWAGSAAALAVFLFALSPYVNSWTVVILSESFSLSMTAVLLASLAMLLRCLGDPALSTRAAAAWAALLVAAAVALTGARDNWPYFLPFVAAVIVLAPRFRVRHPGQSGPKARLGLVLAALLVAVCVADVAAARAGDRWRMGLTNVILQRIVPDEAVRDEWARSYGMPVDPVILSLSGEFDHAKGGLIRRHFAFQTWLTRRGVRSYAHYILTHPLRMLGEIRAMQRVIMNEFAFDYSEAGLDTAAARLVRRWVFFRLPGPADPYLLVLILVTGATTLWGPRRIAPCSWTLFVLALHLPFQSAIGYLADSNEVHRHTLAVALYLRLLGMLSMVLAAVWLRDALRRRRAS